MVYKVGLYTPTILGWDSYIHWFFDKRLINDPAHSGSSGGVAQAIDSWPIILVVLYLNCPVGSIVTVQVYRPL